MYGYKRIHMDMGGQGYICVDMAGCGRIQHSGCQSKDCQVQGIYLDTRISLEEGRCHATPMWGDLTVSIEPIQHGLTIVDCYSLADAVVSASVEPEAFGRVAVEAQAMGKLIIASNIGGSNETILKGKSGFLYKYDDPRELAKILNNVSELDQVSLNSYGIEGRKNVTKKFDVEAMCDSTLREYKKLLNL